MRRIKAIAVVCVLTLFLGMQVNAAEGQEQSLSEDTFLRVGGIDIVSRGEVTGDAPEGATYDAEENVLTLSNYESEIGGGSIDGGWLGDDFTIRLEGENTLYAAGAYFTGCIELREGDLTIEGPGALNLFDVMAIGIQAAKDGNLTINGCTINITGAGSGENYFYGINGNSPDTEILINGSEINIINSMPAGIRVANAGIDSQQANLTIQDSDVAVELTNGNIFGIVTGGTYGGTLNIDQSSIKCITNTDYQNHSMYFYKMSNPDKLHYYVEENDGFIERSFEETFEKGKYEGHPSRYDADKSIIISSEAIPEYCNHQWDEGTVKTEATCEEKGEMIYTCTLCGETKTEEIQALGHDWSEWEVLKEAGCTEPGVQSRECARCKKIENEDIPALGHDYVTTIIKEATCTEDGVKQDKCSRCGDVSSETAIPAIGHSYGEWTVVKEPTFHEDGEEARTCTACGDVDTRVIPKLSESHTHEYSGMEEIIKEATCTAEGRKKVYCTEPECGAFVEEVIPMKEHTPGEWETVKEATCAERGIKQKTCTVCGTVIETQEIEKLPHTYGEWEIVTEPTCTESGVESAVCEVCGETTVRAVEALGHDFKEWEVVTPATCTEKGEEISICTRCQERGTREIEATGHAFGEWEVTKEPTFTEEGQKEAVCEVCGEVKTEVIPKLSGGQSAGTDENDKVNGTQNQKEAEEGVPQTGDESPIVFCIVALIFAAGIVLAVRKRYSR